MNSSLLQNNTYRVRGGEAGLRIAILGTRGIPNRYGGFEQISETLAEGLVQRGHDVTVYCSGQHPDKSNHWRGVHRVLCADPEQRLGTFGQFIYDANCLRHARGENYDALLFMGYTSSSVWGPFFPRNCAILSNMDGLEWKRSKYAAPIRSFLRKAEALAVRYSHAHIADSPVIKEYLDARYGIQSTYIPYSASVQPVRDANVPATYGLAPYHYFMLMARMEPENHVAEILEGYERSGSPHQLVVVGNIDNAYGTKLRKRFKHVARIHFAGAQFDQSVVHHLRSQCILYFHGHSVGGTNPSLLEAMGSGALIAAHRNPFNERILGSDGLYFKSPADVAALMQQSYSEGDERRLRHQHKIATSYRWDAIIDRYEALIHQTCSARR